MADNDHVVLVHGIRDFAYWQVGVRQALEARGFIVELTNYERFDLLRFLAPVPWFRNATMRVFGTRLSRFTRFTEGKRFRL
jgi:hypothetical protein